MHLQKNKLELKSSDDFVGRSGDLFAAKVAALTSSLWFETDGTSDLLDV